MLPFARYGFNKSHAAAYAQITYQTAYLKANFPVEYMTAFLSTAMGDSDKVVKGVLEAKRMGIPILPPSLNNSRADFSIERTADEEGGEREGIRFGLAAVKNVGGGAIDAIIAARKGRPEGRFASLDDLCAHVDSRILNKRVLESLVKAGALDEFGGRGQLLEVLDKAMAVGQGAQRARAAGQLGLFGALTMEAAPAAAIALPDVEPLPRKTILAWEKEVTGLYISEHPLSLVQTGDGITLLGEIGPEQVGHKVTIVAMIASVRRITTKKNTTMGAMVVEDMSGKLELVAFPECFEKHAGLWVEDTILRVVAKVELRNDMVQLVCETAAEFVPPEKSERSRRLATLHLTLTPSGDHWRDIDHLTSLDQLLKHFDGDAPIVLHVGSGSGIRSFRAQGRTVDPCPDLENALRDLLGPAAVRVEQPAPEEDIYEALSAD
jgi:DNA polymerase-3 subunit alpha